MSLNPEPAPKRVGAFAFVLVIAIAAFVLTLGLSAYLTRYHSPSPQGGEANTAPEVADVDVALDLDLDLDGGRPRLRQDAGEARMAMADAGVVFTVSADGGSTIGQLPPPEKSARLDDAVLRETLGRPLAACIAQSLVEDPSARIRVKVTAQAADGAWKLVSFSPASSPYFRRCAKRLALPTTLTVPTNRVFVVERTGDVTVLNVASPKQE